MKNRIFLMTIVIFFGVIILSCNLKKHVTKTTTVDSVKTEKTDSLKPFEQRFRKNLAIGDSVTVYNSVKIEIHKNLDEEYNYVEGGVIFSVDSGKIAKFVPELTKGKIVALKMKNGSKTIIDEITVSSTKNEVQYNFNYFRRGSLNPEVVEVNGIKVKLISKNPETFILGGNATLIFRGKPYKIDLTTDEQKCYLLVDYRRIVAEESSDEGWTY